MKSFTKSYLIKAPVSDVWDCLTQAAIMDQWGAEPATFEAEEDGEFTMWGDYLSGKVLEITPPERLVEQWLAEGMDEPSQVTFELFEDDDEVTKVILTHSHVPDEMADELNEGWDNHYLGQIKAYLES